MRGTRRSVRERMPLLYAKNSEARMGEYLPSADRMSNRLDTSPGLDVSIRPALNLPAPPFVQPLLTAQPAVADGAG